MVLREGIKHYDNEEHMATTINRTRRAYDELVAQLSKLGTEVARDRVLETDTIAPYRFVREGRVEFIFPPQTDAEPMSIKSGPVSNTLGRLVTERAMRKFDESRVECHLTVDYDDADRWAAMSVAEVHGASALPAEVSVALGVAFAVYESV